MGEGKKRKEGFSPSALSHFRFHLSPFPPETPDTQAKASPTRTIADTIVEYQQGQGFLFHTPRNERFKIQAEDKHTPSHQRRPP